MTDLSCPIADVDAVLSAYSESVRMRVVAWILARDVSPGCTPRSVLTQLGEECPDDESNHAANVAHSLERLVNERDAAGPVDNVERVSAGVEVHRTRPGDGGRRTVQGSRGHGSALASTHPGCADGQSAGPAPEVA